jgi:manganese oxidase
MSLSTDEPTHEPAPLDLDALESQLKARQTRRDGWTLMIWAFAAVALFASAVAIGFGMRAIDESKQGGGAGAAGAAGPAAQVTLKEFSITPLMISASQSGGVDITNNGNVEHNFAVQGTDLKTAMIPAGGSAHLDLSSLAPGTYTVLCQVAGHQAAGMQAMLHLGAGSTPGLGAAGSAAGDSSSAATTMSPEQMDAEMKASLAAFPAKTAGLGGQVLAPTVLADGTKQFDLTAAVTDWEVSPGKTVKAMTYNGTVPGPTIKVNPGDKVKVVLHNNLPQSTSIHFHGLLTPNSMDGTTYVTQDPVKTGETFTYEWTVQNTPAVGMYHSHHNAVEQVPDGLAGAFLVGDEPVPAGVTVSQQQVMVLDDSGVIGYAINGKSFPATAPIVAKQGDWVEVNYMNEGTQIHPMHLHGMEQMVIAKDGNPLATPELEDTITVAPGERYTVLIHATELGTWVWHCHILTHAENEHGMFGMVTALVVQ